ncbi:efflux transporter outer membrane subunit [Sphingomonas sp. PAMC 26621]|uniref:efflux transporter outer membrane subunit n=1 Tax=Sphingomonas sp. PAMC 26621 TaxID=1112213 RepID=UPI0002881583|nr:efflux transporter outer membrane subunit [Sphingomonas sp. PAMC 26621]
MKRVTLAAPLLLIGCTVGPQHPTTALSYAPPVRPERIAAASGPDQTIAPGTALDAEWWHRFRNPVLDTLVARALRSNNDLAVADAALRQARAQLVIAGAAGKPQVDASYQVERARVSQALQSPLADPNQTLYTLHTAQLSVTYPLDLFGAERNRKRSARAAAEVAGDRLLAARTTIVANLVLAVIQHASLAAQIDAANDSISGNRDILQMLQRRQALGDIGAADVAAQQTVLSTAEALLPPLIRQRDHQRTLIALLLGVAPGTPLPDLPRLETLTLPDTLPVGLPAQIVAGRPDVRAAEAQMRGAGADLGVAIAARLPNILLTATGGSTAVDFGGLFASGNPFWALLGGVTQPIFHAGALRGQQHVAEAALDSAKAQYRSAALQAFADVADSLSGLRTDAAALDAATRANDAATQNLRFTRRQLALGGVGTLTVFNATAASAQATALLIQARAARMADTVALYQAVGGGVLASGNPQGITGAK